MHARYFACADFKGRDGHTFHTQMLVTRVGAPMSLRFWREHEDSERVGSSAWSLFASDTKYFAPSQAPFIINWRVRNLDRMLAQLRAAGVRVEGKVAEDAHGKVAWVVDPRATRSSCGSRRRDIEGPVMHVERQIDPVRRIAVLTITGELSDRELLGLADLIEAAPDIGTDFSLLIDLRNADGSRITPGGVRAMAARRLVLSPQARRAVVVPSALGYGMARMYELLRGDRGGAMRVFRDLEDARRWIETGLA